MITAKKLGAAELMYSRAQQMGLQPSWVTPNGVFCITVDGDESYINFARSPLNSHVGVSLANDKYLARLIMERNNLPNIPFARPKTHQDAHEFLQRYTKIIAKPYNGFGAKDIHIVTTATQLDALDISHYILEKYIAGAEMRYLILNNQVIGVHESKYGTSVDSERDLERISYPTELWDQTQVEMALTIARVLGLRFAAVDFIIDDFGVAHILEVNSLPGLKWFHAPTSGPVVDVARLFLEAIVADQTESVIGISIPSLYIEQTNESEL